MDLKKAIESIEDTISTEVEEKIYIIDNTPDTAILSLKEKNVVSRIKKADNIEYIKTDNNIGFGKGHNLVLNQIDSTYHVILNPDIIFKNDAIGTMIEFMENDLSTGMCIPKILTPDGDVQKAYRKELTVLDMFVRMFVPRLFPKRMQEHTLQSKDYTRPFLVPFGQGSCLMIRTPLLKELQGFDSHFFMYLEDADLCKRVNEKSRLMYCPRAIVMHKWERGSQKSLRLFAVHLRSMIYYFKKWGWRFF